MTDYVGHFEHDGCLRECHVEVVGSVNWAILAEYGITSSDRVGYWVDGVERIPGPRIPTWASADGRRVTMTWWIDGTRYSTDFADPTDIGFDFMLTKDPHQQRVVRQFLSGLARRFGARIRVEHEYRDFEPFYIDPPAPGR